MSQDTDNLYGDYLHDANPELSMFESMDEPIRLEGYFSVSSQSSRHTVRDIKKKKGKHRLQHNHVLKAYKPVPKVGGGIYYFDKSMPASEDNGGDVIFPEIRFSDYATRYNKFGCWVRVKPRMKTRRAHKHEKRLIRQRWGM